MGSFLKILAALALVTAIALGLARLRPDTSVLSLLPQDLPEVRGLQLLLKHFGLPDELLITVTAEHPAEADALATSLAEHLREKTPSTIRTAPPWIENPSSLAPLAAHALLNQPPAAFQSTLERLDPATARTRAQDSLDRLATSMSPEDIARLGYDPLGLLDNLPASSADLSMREFSSADSTTRLLYANPKNQTPLAEWTPTVIAAISSWNQSHPQCRTGWTGEPAFVHELATAMSRDMRLSSIGSIAFAAVLFFLAYRRLRPLAPLLLCVAGGFLAALGLTAWIHPQISIIGVGFAAILVGLTVDYGFLITQRRLAFGENPAQLRAATAPGIWAAAATTAAGFLTLNLSGVPGIAQLGNLVAIGVLAGAFLMLRFHTAAICRIGQYCQDSRAKKGGMAVSAVQRLAFFFTTNPSKPSSQTPHTGGTPVLHSFPCRGARILRLAQLATATIVLASLAVLALRGFPAWETNTRAMQPRDTVAYPTLALVESLLGSDQPTLAFVIEEPTPASVAQKLAEARAILTAEKNSGAITAFELPDSLWPHPDFQKQNLATLAARPPDTARLAAALDETGFDTPARFLATSIPAQWNEWQASTPPIIPSSDSFAWIARRTINLNQDRPAACGFATLPSNDPAAARRLASTLSSHGIHPASWEALGPVIATHSRQHAIPAAICFLVLLFATLLASFRSLAEPLLALGTVSTGLLVTCGLMRVLGIDWNFLNLCAASISIATGIDYAIHMLFALRESRGDTLQALRLAGKPIALCAATTAAGFGSLATAQTPGLASLGIVCALAATSSALAALFLLPSIGNRMNRKPKACGMFLRKKRKVAGGESYEYWSLCRTVRTARGPRQEVVACLGKLDEEEVRSGGWEDVDDLLAGRKPAVRASQSELFGSGESRGAEGGNGRWEREDVGSVQVERVREFGRVYLALAVWRRLGLDKLLGELMEAGREMVDWVTVVSVLVAARFCAIRSELGIAEAWYEKTALEDLLGVEKARMNDDRLYRSLDALTKHKERLCGHLIERYKDWFGVRARHR